MSENRRERVWHVDRLSVRISTVPPHSARRPCHKALSRGYNYIKNKSPTRAVCFTPPPPRVECVSVQIDKGRVFDDQLQVPSKVASKRYPTHRDLVYAGSPE